MYACKPCFCTDYRHEVELGFWTLSSKETDNASQALALCGDNSYYSLSQVGFNSRVFITKCKNYKDSRIWRRGSWRCFFLKRTPQWTNKVTTIGKSVMVPKVGAGIIGTTCAVRLKARWPALQVLTDLRHIIHSTGLCNTRSLILI